MDSPLYSMKHLSLGNIKKIIDSLGDFSENTLTAHSLAMIINKSGEVTFTSCGWKLLSESGFNDPLAKVIVNAALKYTNLCGDDCKHFIFILREMFSVIQNETNRSEEAFVRRKLMDEICFVKRALPCIFKCVHDMSGFQLADSRSVSKDLYDVVFTFMSARFSVRVSKVLSSLISDFVQRIKCEQHSLKLGLQYVIEHFDIFCCKILSSLTESRVSEGLLFYRKGTPSELDLKDAKCIVVWDLSMEMQTKDVAWKITDDAFASQLNTSYVYRKVFEYLKSQKIALILTPSVSDGNLKSLCDQNDIFLVDRLERDEIECLLSCFHLYALENLNESLESHHIGQLSSAKSLSINKSQYLHLCCKNPSRIFNVHHILLSAPCDSIWKEYYSESLNCFKMIYQWLQSGSSNICFLKEYCKKEIANKSTNIIDEEAECCLLCYEVQLNCEKENEFENLCGVNSCQNNGLLTPGLWEFFLKNVLEKNSECLSLSSNVVLRALHFAILKSLCQRIGMPFTNVRNVESIYAAFAKKCKRDGTNLLEPVVCKEILIFSILDLVSQLLKIGSIVFVK